jgi:hypothetical protein
MPTIKIAKKPSAIKDAVQVIAGEAYGKEDLEADVEVLAELGSAIAESKETLNAMKASIEVAQASYDEVAARVSTYVVNQNEVPPDQAWPVFVKGHKVHVSALTLKRTITDIKAVYAKLGDAFWSLCKINLTDLDKYTTEPEREAFVKAERTGERKVTVEPYQKVKA